jgi:hypothetical protein
MCTLTMGDNAFLYIDDPAAPSRAEVLAAQMHPPSQSTPPPATPPPSLTQPVESQVTQTEPHTQSERSNQPVTVQPFRVPPHYRMTFLTVRPPGALEHLLLQLRARWMPIRQTSQMNAERGAGAEQRYAGQHVVINGHILRIGQDWLVRIGNVALAGGALRGMLLEVNPFRLFDGSWLIRRVRRSICLFPCSQLDRTAHRSCCRIFYYLSSHSPMQ